MTEVVLMYVQAVVIYTSGNPAVEFDTAKNIDDKLFSVKNL